MNKKNATLLNFHSRSLEILKFITQKRIGKVSIQINFITKLWLCPFKEMSNWWNVVDYKSWAFQALNYSTVTVRLHFGSFIRFQHWWNENNYSFIRKFVFGLKKFHRIWFEPNFDWCIFYTWIWYSSSFIRGNKCASESLNDF